MTGCALLMHAFSVEVGGILGVQSPSGSRLGVERGAYISETFWRETSSAGTAAELDFSVEVTFFLAMRIGFSFDHDLRGVSFESWEAAQLHAVSLPWPLLL